MPRPTLLLIVALAWVGGCAAPARSWSFRARVFKAARGERPSAPTRARDLKPSPHAVPAAALVERALHARGLRFGTDGTVGALHGYLESTGRAVPPGRARAGDVLFFDMNGAGCADHAGLVEAVDLDGRIAFREARQGQVLRSYVHAGTPDTRRDPKGRILNTFLRPKRIEDPPATRYFAGQMLCGVFRPR
jgi:hypothetical protein